MTDKDTIDPDMDIENVPASTQWLEAAQSVLGGQNTQLLVNMKYNPSSPAYQNAINNGAYTIGDKALLSSGEIVDADDPKVQRFLDAKAAQSAAGSPRSSYVNPAKAAVDNSDNGSSEPQEGM